MKPERDSTGLKRRGVLGSLLALFGCGVAAKSSVQPNGRPSDEYLKFLGEMVKDVRTVDPATRAVADCIGQTMTYGMRCVFGHAEPKPLRGFPDGYTWMDITGDDWVRVFVDNHEHDGAIREFLVRESADGAFWEPAGEVGVSLFLRSTQPGVTTLFTGAHQQPLFD
jgi:hypothetical protein